MLLSAQEHSAGRYLPVRCCNNYEYVLIPCLRRCKRGNQVQKQRAAIQSVAVAVFGSSRKMRHLLSAMITVRCNPEFSRGQADPAHNPQQSNPPSISIDSNAKGQQTADTSGNSNRIASGFAASFALASGFASRSGGSTSCVSWYLLNPSQLPHPPKPSVAIRLSAGVR